MKKELLQNVAVLAITIIFTALFYQAGLGLNTCLFGLGLISFLYWQDPERLRDKRLLALGGAVLLSGFAILINHSPLAVFAYVISLFVFVGISHQQTLRFLVYGGMLAFVNVFQLPVQLIRQFKLVEKWLPGMAVVLRYARTSLLPLLVFFIFFSLYSWANPHFSDLTENIFTRFGDMISWLSLDPLLFWTIVLGLIIGGAAMYPPIFDWFEQLQGMHREQLERRRKPWITGLRFGMTALKSEFKMGLVLFGILNGLLLVVNVVDLRFIWLGPQDVSAVMLSNYVHEGTYLLIFSILLAIAVLLYWFRGNLNFFPNNQNLRRLGYAWIVQNAWLALSVAVRNFHYVYAYGLTYKRIGVFFFLLLVLAGLFFLFLKVRDQKTLYFLVHKNTEMAFFALILMSLINWNTLITRYNLNHTAKNGIDVDYLLYDLPDENWYLLHDQEARLQAAAQSEYSDYAAQAIARKRNRLETRLHNMDWRSWNWPLYWNARYFQTSANQ